ncbi:MAG: exodeoxyribonuclease VII large subunit [Verrucomicrobiota bacterium]|nr:exodeoxyribonuclease VII large subunit [Verrucomicrobiota bacterium]
MPRTKPEPDGQILSVGQLTRRLKDVIESALPDVWVRGELSNFRRQESGHCYFSLKDKESQIPAVLFRGDAARTTVELRDGRQILAWGTLSVYEPRGYYQLIVRSVLEDGLGRLQQEFERLKRMLAAEGLFDAARKKRIPTTPRTLGFVTSPTGAAVQDFISVLRRRGWKGRLVILPARVQGAEAAGEIVAQIKRAERLGIFDLLVVGRGGGSLEDMWPFNEEAVARAVADCTIPTISAVGHEIDFTLADFAADKRAETPTAAAELISSSYIKVVDSVTQLRDALYEQTERELETHQRRLELLHEKLRRHSPQNQLEQMAIRLDELQNRLNYHTASRLQAIRGDIKMATFRLSRVSPEQRVSRLREKVSGLAQRIENLGPAAVLRRGYAMVINDLGGIAESAAVLQPNDAITIQFHDGRASAQIKQCIPHMPPSTGGSVSHTAPTL